MIDGWGCVPPLRGWASFAGADPGLAAWANECRASGADGSEAHSMGGDCEWSVDRTGSGSEGPQELDDGVFVRSAQFFELFFNVRGFSAMAGDGVEEGDGRAVVHQARTQADSPQGSGANLVAATLEASLGEIVRHLAEDLATVVFGRGLQDSVAGADVVHEVIAVGVRDDGAECGWNCVSSAVDLCTGGSAGEGWDMADGASDFVE